VDAKRISNDERASTPDGRPPLTRRVAALAAIAGLAGAMVSVGFAVIRGDAWRLPVVLLSVMAMVIGLWYLLSRRGAASLVGAAMAAVGLVALFVVIFTADYRGLPFLIAIVLIFVSAGAARYALRRDERTLRAAPKPGKGVARANRPVLLMNPKSGGGKVERYRLIDECQSRGIEPMVLQPGDDLRQMAADAIAGGADVIGMAGGDGSQALVAAVAADHDVAYVCVPAGTRNHFALDLGLDRDDVVGALDAFSDAVERRVDLARVNGRIFVNNACMGLYAKIVQSPAYRDAKLKTSADMLPDLIGPDATPFDLRFVGPDGVEWQAAHLVLVSNDSYELDHIGGRGTRQRMDLGVLGVVAAYIAGPREATTFVALEAAGQIRRFPGWLEWEVPDFRLTSSGPIEIAVDGEALRMDPPLVFESLPGRLRIRLPKTASGVAPAGAAVRLSASTIGDLARTAFGRRGR
jgi:diacylglycerol kinase family enzyme